MVLLSSQCSPLPVPPVLPNHSHWAGVMEEVTRKGHSELDRIHYFLVVHREWTVGSTVAISCVAFLRSQPSSACPCAVIMRSLHCCILCHHMCTPHLLSPLLYPNHSAVTPTILLPPQPFYCHPNHSTATPTILLPPQPFCCHPNHSAVTPTILLSPQPFCCHLHTRIPQRTEKRYYPTHLAVNLLSGGCDWAVIQLTNQIASCICMCYTTEHKQTVHRK